MTSSISLLLGSAPLTLWLGFIALVLVLLALDLGVFHRRPHEVSNKEAAVWTAIWISLAGAFNAFVFWDLGHQAGIEFLTGYVIEKSLSVDNLFVMLLVFTSFGVPKIYQHRILFWGILGALVTRGVMIILGAELLNRFHAVIYVFGGFLVFTGVRMLFARGEKPDPRKNLALRIFTRFVPTTDRIDGKHFFVVEAGKRVATPLLVALVVVEAMDVVFAVDSIPAIFAVTTDPFIVFTSNVFAILGLRSLYFLLANVVERFVHLEIGLSIILTYVGVKMLVSGWYPIPTPISLAVILGILAITIITSIVANRRAHAKDESPGSCA
ncbi:TerC family protein [Vulgatibacter incomptus]|uniref:Integral membrane protein TerC n=1 Tax=Vulgatibacter incomptus TaxID=1391653 RepID=A0A0K1PGZ5_9BACT|nr:TerC family protein [Vulgatibacter incomptus]AKU92785.1 Integral membrane protein TerC [Vulgatibacter incomptus]